MQAERARLVKEMRAINDAVNGRAWTADETEKYTKIEADVDRIGSEIEAETKRSERASKLADLEKRIAEPGKPASKPEPSGQAKRTSPLASPEYRDAFEVYLNGGMGAFAAEVAKRADTLAAGVFTKAGALIGPEQFVAELIKAVDDDVFVRRYARRFQIASSASLGVPTLDTDIDDADWTSELLTGSQGDIAVGKRELRPHPMAKRVKVSKTLDRLSAIPVSTLVQDRLRYKFGVTDEKAFLTGNGVQRPLGIFTASADGVPTSRDVSTDNTTTAITADGLINAKHFMKASYWRGARWTFHRDAVKAIRKLKDGNGQYIWGMGLAGQPDTLLDLPMDISEFAPNTFTAGLYVGALAYWPAYWIVDALDMTVQFLDQLYAETNTNGYIARKETDGAPVLAEAFVRVTLAP
jgi:HK97 family phage major capsid protein